MLWSRFALSGNIGNTKIWFGDKPSLLFRFTILRLSVLLIPLIKAPNSPKSGRSQVQTQHNALVTRSTRGSLKMCHKILICLSIFLALFRKKYIYRAATTRNIYKINNNSRYISQYQTDHSMPHPLPSPPHFPQDCVIIGVVIMGARNSGKSSLMYRHTRNELRTSPFYNGPLQKIEGTEFKFRYFEQDNYFHGPNPKVFKGVKAVVVAYDVADPVSAGMREISVCEYGAGIFFKSLYWIYIQM